MFNMSFIEMFVVFTIALLVLGPERLPVAARELGKNIGKIKRFFSNMQRQIDQEIRLEELNRKVMAQLDETQKFINEQKEKIAETEAIESTATTSGVAATEQNSQPEKIENKPSKNDGADS